MMKVFEDHRGTFSLIDTDTGQVFAATNIKPYTFRGMHFQTDPVQTKTIKVLNGTIMDFIYDLETKEVHMSILNIEEPPLTIESKYAHGYLTLSRDTIVLYETKGKFNPNTYTSIPYHTIPKIKDLVYKTISEEVITINNKDRGIK